MIQKLFCKFNGFGYLNSVSSRSSSSKSKAEDEQKAKSGRG